MIAGTFKSCKVFGTALQFSEWDKMCWLSITTGQVEELPLQDPNPNYICGEKKNQNGYCGNSQNAIAGSCEHVHGSDVQATVSGAVQRKQQAKNHNQYFLKASTLVLNLGPMQVAKVCSQNRFSKRQLNGGREKL